MRKFIKNVVLFLSPVFLFLAVPTSILLFTGEFFRSLEQVATTENTLIGYAYNSENYSAIKWQNVIENEKREILALGSSRVLEFTEEMFISKFYNAGYTVRKANEFLTFLSGIPKDKLPEVLILGLDQWMFNGDWSAQLKTRGERDWPTLFKSIPNLNTYKLVYQDLFDRKYSMGVIRNNGAIRQLGLNARFNGKGLRPDGSMNYGLDQLPEKDNLIRFKKTYGQVQNASGRFKYADKVDPDAMSQIEDVLGFCDEHKIKVIMFLPPFPEFINEAMVEMGEFKFIDEAKAMLESLSREYNQEFYDLSSMSQLGVQDHQFIDGIHGDETVYWQIAKEFASKGEILKGYVSVMKASRKD